MKPLMQVSLFARDLEGLSGFYRDLFDLPEVTSLRSPIFRGYMAGEVMIGFSAFDAYGMLALDERKEGDGDQTALTMQLATQDEVGALHDRAVAAGARSLKEPFDTYYGWRMAVIRDPEGNAIRLAHAGTPPSA